MGCVASSPFLTMWLILNVGNYDSRTTQLSVHIAYLSITLCYWEAFFDRSVFCYLLANLLITLVLRPETLDCILQFAHLWLPIWFFKSFVGYVGHFFPMLACFAISLTLFVFSTSGILLPWSVFSLLAYAFSSLFYSVFLPVG